MVTHILEITHKHGRDLTGYKTKDGAWEGLWRWVEFWWGEVESVAGEMPEDPEKAIELYFDKHPHEFFEILDVEVEE
jgi:hypothetical protein